MIGSFDSAHGEIAFHCLLLHTNQGGGLDSIHADAVAVAPVNLIHAAFLVSKDGPGGYLGTELKGDRSCRLLFLFLLLIGIRILDAGCQEQQSNYR